MPISSSHEMLTGVYTAWIQYLEKSRQLLLYCVVLADLEHYTCDFRSLLFLYLGPSYNNPIKKNKALIWDLSQWAFGAKMTLYQRRCDVITSHRRWYDVIFTSCAWWVVCHTVAVMIYELFFLRWNFFFLYIFFCNKHLPQSNKQPKAKLEST